MTNDLLNPDNLPFRYYGYINPSTKIIAPLMVFYGQPNVQTNFIQLSQEQYQNYQGKNIRLNDDDSIEEYLPSPTLESQRAILATITAQKKSLGIYFQPTGTNTALLFPSDDASYANTLQQAQVVQLGAWPEDTAWTLSDGTTIPMKSDDVSKLFKTMTNYRTACQNHAAALDKQLKQDLNTDLTVGWPDNHT